MNPQSASTLAWASAVATLLSFSVMSPAAQFLSCLVAAVVAAIPALLGSKTPRIAGCVLLTISLTLAYQSYPRFEKDQQDYRTRAQAHSISPYQQQGKNKFAVEK